VTRGIDIAGRVQLSAFWRRGVVGNNIMRLERHLHFCSNVAAGLVRCRVLCCAARSAAVLAV